MERKKGARKREGGSGGREREGLYHLRELVCK